MKICPVRAEFFLADGQMDGQTDKWADRNDEAHSCFSQFCKHA